MLLLYLLSADASLYVNTTQTTATVSSNMSPLVNDESTPTPKRLKPFNDDLNHSWMIFGHIDDLGNTFFFANFKKSRQKHLWIKWWFWEYLSSFFLEILGNFPKLWEKYSQDFFDKIDDFDDIFNNILANTETFSGDLWINRWFGEIWHFRKHSLMNFGQWTYQWFGESFHCVTYNEYHFLDCHQCPSYR